jgi:hypothetical protein
VYSNVFDAWTILRCPFIPASISPLTQFPQKGAKKKEIEGVNAPEIQKLCDNI